MMYDADNWYVALHWKDTTPMGNSHHPRYQANKGWAGDSVQLRIKNRSHLARHRLVLRRQRRADLGMDYGKSLTEPFDGGGKQLLRTEGWKLTDGVEMAFSQGRRWQRLRPGD